MLDRAFILIDHPPPPGWDGVWDSAEGPWAPGQGGEPATFA
jgi:hypothetical protein